MMSPELMSPRSVVAPRVDVPRWCPQVVSPGGVPKVDVLR